jgi:hypothetical protein
VKPHLPVAFFGRLYTTLIFLNHSIPTGCREFSMFVSVHARTNPAFLLNYCTEQGEKKNISTSVPQTGFRLISSVGMGLEEREIEERPNPDNCNLSEQCCLKFSISSTTVARQKKFWKLKKICHPRSRCFLLVLIEYCITTDGQDSARTAWARYKHILLCIRTVTVGGGRGGSRKWDHMTGAGAVNYSATL